MLFSASKWLLPILSLTVWSRVLRILAFAHRFIWNASVRSDSFLFQNNQTNTSSYGAMEYPDSDESRNLRAERPPWGLTWAPPSPWAVERPKQPKQVAFCCLDGLQPSHKVHNPTALGNPECTSSSGNLSLKRAIRFLLLSSDSVSAQYARHWDSRATSSKTLCP